MQKAEGLVSHMSKGNIKESDGERGVIRRVVKNLGCTKGFKSFPELFCSTGLPDWWFFLKCGRNCSWGGKKIGEKDFSNTNFGETFENMTVLF